MTIGNNTPSLGENYSAPEIDKRTVNEATTSILDTLSIEEKRKYEAMYKNALLKNNLTTTVDKSFTNLVKDFQNENNLIGTGILDETTATLLVTKYPNLTFPTVVQQKYVAENKVMKDFSNEREKMETQLTSGNLSKIGVSRSDALKKVADSFGMTESYNIEQLRAKIKEYQKNHNLGVDGKIGKEVYIEMRAGEVLRQAKVNIETAGISAKTQENILFVLKNGNVQGSNYLKMMMFINEFKQKPTGKQDYTAFFGEIEKNAKNPTGNTGIPSQKEVVKDLNKKNASGSSPLGDIPKLMDGTITGEEYWERNKGALGIGAVMGLLFFGDKVPPFSKLPGFGGFWGRLGWLTVGIIGGGGELLDSLGTKFVKKITDRNTEDGTETGESNTTKTEAYKNGEKFAEDAGNWMKSVPGKIAETYRNIMDKDWSMGDLKGKISDNFKEITGGIAGYNLGLKKSKDSEKNFIEEDKLTQLQNIAFSDSTFLNTNVSKLSEINKSNFGEYLTEEQKEKITKDRLKEEFVTFVKNHVKEQTKNLDQNNAIVRDIFGKGIVTQNISKLREKFAQTEYVEGNPELNNFVQTEIYTLIGMSSNDTMNQAGVKLAEKFRAGKVEEFKISEYTKIKDFGTLKSAFENLKYIQEGRKKIDATISHMDTYKASDVTTAGNIEGLYRDLNNEKSKFKLEKNTKVSAEMLGTGKVEKRYLELKQGLLEKAQVLSLATLGGKNVAEELKKVEAELGEVEEQAELETIGFKGNVPTETAELSEFTKWYETNKDNIEKLEKELKEWEEKNKKLKEKDANVKEQPKSKKLEKLEADYNTFKANLKKKIGSLKTKSDEASTEIEAIEVKNISVTQYDSVYKEIVENEKMEGLVFLHETEKTALKNIFPEKNNPITDLSNSQDTVKSKVKVKIETLLQNLTVNIKTDIDVNNTEKLTAVSNEIAEKWKKINELSRDDMTVFGVKIKIPGTDNDKLNTQKEVIKNAVKALDEKFTNKKDTQYTEVFKLKMEEIGLEDVLKQVEEPVGESAGDNGEKGDEGEPKPKPADVVTPPEDNGGKTGDDSADKPKPQAKPNPDNSPETKSEEINNKSVAEDDELGRQALKKLQDSGFFDLGKNENKEIKGYIGDFNNKQLTPDSEKTIENIIVGLENIQILLDKKSKEYKQLEKIIENLS
ncbi:hypothetical protein KGV52_01715 [Candidatus Gracilibacteria bacterium]|nr:hypothetical protein [Candidatus Gracilibacteria bacterium]